MEYGECVTERERWLWVRWRTAVGRVSALEAQKRHPRPAKRRSRRRQPMSPAALVAHRKRNAARARLYRRRLSLDARRRVLDQARALGAIPDGFDQDAFLAGQGPVDDAPEIDDAKLEHDDAPLLVIYPDQRTPAHPEVLTFWLALRAAELEGRLGFEHLDLMREFVERMPSLVAGDPTQPTQISPILYYPDGRSEARGAWRMPLYPNGRLIASSNGELYYPSGRIAYTASSKAWYYPNGTALTDGYGVWWSPTRPAGTAVDLAVEVCRNAGALGDLIAVGLARIRREQPGLVELALLEAGWMFLRG